MLIGIHTSIQKGYAEAVRWGDEIGAEVIQIFVRQNLTWKSRRVDEVEIERFSVALKNAVNVKEVIAHSSYLINLASDNRSTIARSVSIMAEELEICRRLGIDIYVMHPGAHRGAGVELGIKKVVEGIRRVRERLSSDSVTVAFETMAGAGTQIGSSIEEISSIIQGTRGIIKSAICIDTAHLFGAGYNIIDEDEYERLISAIDNKIGLENLLVCHLNDSKVSLGSHRDRHDHIGLGKLNTEVFYRILNDKRIENAFAVLETPKEKRTFDDVDYDIINIEILKRLRDG